MLSVGLTKASTTTTYLFYYVRYFITNYLLFSIQPLHEAPKLLELAFNLNIPVGNSKHRSSPNKILKINIDAPSHSWCKHIYVRKINERRTDNHLFARNTCSPCPYYYFVYVYGDPVLYALYLLILLFAANFPPPHCCQSISGRPVLTKGERIGPYKRYLFSGSLINY